MNRTKLPDTRPAVLHTFEVDGVQGYLNVGLDDDANPKELFLTITKEGSTIGGFADSLARLVSIALQYGMPLEVICQKMRGQKFAPFGNTKNPQIPRAESIVDYIFTWLSITFPPETRLLEAPQNASEGLNGHEIDTSSTES